MPIIEFDKKSFKDTIRDLLPINQADFVMDAIDHDSTTESDFDEIALHLTKEQKETTPVMLIRIKQEIYEYFCTSTPLYSDIREATITPTQLVTVLTTQIIENSEIKDPSEISGAVMVALIGALKVGKQNWCENKSLTGE